MKFFAKICLLLAIVGLCSCRRVNQNAGDQESTKRHAPDEINYRDPGRLFRMFVEADENENNVVELWEHLEYFRTHMTPLQLRMMFLAADKDENKEVTFEELMEFRKEEWSPHDHSHAE